MRARTRNPFLTVRTEGSILPIDVLTRVIERDKDLEGLAPESYHLAKNERINEVATRAWNRLQGAWEAFREASERLSESDLGTSLTREKWLQVIFQELGYGRLMTHRAWELGDRTYPISHSWGSTPIHLVGCRVSMDKKQAGVAGAARVSPHSLVQEFLNRSDDHLWGIVSNGLILRVLRDNVSLTRQAYVEFDLEAMMEGEAFSDFVLLFMVCHQSRVEVPEDKTPDSCRLEQWHNAAAEQGIRALDELRSGVKNALDTLGVGFLAHPANTALRQKLKDGALSTQDYYRQLLRVVYRLLFLFVAEDRDLLYDPDAPIANRAVYASYYSTHRIRELAQRRRGTKHADLYRSLCLVFDKLREGCPELALPALGSFLFSGESTPDLDSVDITNRDLLVAFRQLACTIDGNALRPIDYRNLGPEELGSVYESLLEMHPQVNTDAATFKLDVAAGSERKTTGSFYTHSSLVQCLLDSALDPVLDEAVAKPDPEAALLNLKICDPASGSGHFLIAAAHRVAKRLAAVRTGEDEPSPDATRSALRDVIGRCIYGVDINPMAVELCKISLWMEAMEPGKALGFLDHHIKCGNSLLGTTPALMADGIPDDAFKPIEGDDKVVCKDLKAQNKSERAGLDMFSAVTERKARVNLTEPFRQLVDEDDASPSARKKKAEHYRSLVQSPEYVNAWFVADAWCAAFVLPKTSLDDPAVTHRRFRNWEANADAAKPEDRAAVQTIANQYQFFHWHLAFPEVFRNPGDDEETDNVQCWWSGGFDCVLGNPPWEMVQMDPREFFASRAPEIARQPTMAARNRAVLRLAEEDPVLHAEYEAARRIVDGTRQLLHQAKLYPLTSYGRLNSAPLFAEAALRLVSGVGRSGLVLPTEIATGAFNQFFFQTIVTSGRLASLYDFENRKRLFSEVHSGAKFCLLTLAGSESGTSMSDLAFFLHATSDLANQEKHFTLTPEEFLLLNPNTLTCPTFRSKQAAECTKLIYGRVPVLAKDDDTSVGNPWGHKPMLMFMMNTDSHLFKTFDELLEAGLLSEGNAFSKHDAQMVPLYEAKMFQLFDHRAADVVVSKLALKRQGQPQKLSEAEHAVPSRLATPRYWIPNEALQARLEGYAHNWLIAVTKVTSPTNHRTFVPALLPRYALGDSAFGMLLLGPDAVPEKTAAFLANASSFCLDYIARQKLGGVNMAAFIQRQLPFLPPSAYAVASLWNRKITASGFLLGRVLELCFTAWDLEAFANECAYFGPPFRWESTRRSLIRCELDAAFFHLYLGTPQDWKEQGSKELLEYFPAPRDAVEYIMETFPIVKRKDEAEHGEYRTKLQILDIYDRMQHAIDTSEPYQTLLDPPPGPPADEHGNFLPLPEWKPGHPKPPNWPSHIHPPKEVI